MITTTQPDFSPTQYSLNQNYPNPFNPSTTISFSLPQSGRVKLEVYDVTGRFITRLVDGVMGVGAHSVQFEGENIPSGVYIYALKTEGYSSVRKMLLLK